MEPDPRFDEAIHAPTRLRICGLLRPVDSADFAVLRSTLGLSEANLSKTLRSLVALGYVRTDKAASPSRADARRTTTVALTSHGRRAFDAHLAALRDLANGRLAPSVDREDD
ncbi:transcriptional regulator [Nocardiopsis sp. MG754419]|uniref:transcriptional regulator n=1 Tax=Nocardiopsis sp. MG754419 TaxID=2259865 RepID=UPI001BAC98A6|nr:transcriptional regulator [Nocardiopsis sp. MG754419]MBR8740854.1 transcriptional regulator [Nocardiopsis sp. MG754419]